MSDSTSGNASKSKSSKTKLIKYAGYFLLVIAVVLVIIGIVMAVKKYKEYMQLSTSFNSLSLDFTNLRTDISKNNKTLSDYEEAIDGLRADKRELENLIERNRSDIDEQQRIERERKELQEELERLQEYRGKEDSIFAGVSLNECSEIVIYLFNSYRDFISQHESEYPDLTDGDKIFFLPDFYSIENIVEGNAKNDARSDWSNLLMSSFEEYIVEEIGIPFDIIDPSDNNFLEFLILLSTRRIQTITEDKTNIPDDIIFEDIFDPDLYSIIHFSQDEINTSEIYPSIDDSDVLLTASECILGPVILDMRCIV